MRYFWVIVVAAGLFGCGVGGAAKVGAAKSPTLNMPISDSSVTKYDTIALGRIIEGESVSGSFEVCNVSAEPLVVVNVITGCGCTDVKYDSKPIMGGERRRFDFTFDSQGRVGWQIKSIEVIDANHNVGRVFMSAEVVVAN